MTDRHAGCRAAGHRAQSGATARGREGALCRVGLTEREARAQGRAIRVAKLPMSKVIRALETGETRGFMKAVVDADSGQILGCAVLGSEGGEIMTMIQVAMLGRLTATAMADAVFTHPLLAEGLNALFATVEP